VIVESTGDAPVGVPGVLVVGVCAVDIGPDGVWGTADDTYGTPVEVFTDADGRYEIDLYGEACWAIVAPPDDYAIEDDDGQLIAASQAAVPQVLDVSTSDVQQPTVVLYREVSPDAVPPPTGTPPGDHAGRSPALPDLLHRLVDRGLLPATIAQTAALGTDGARSATSPVDVGARILPAPADEQLADPAQSRPTLTWLVLAIAGLLAASILLGLARPRTAAAE
jgi:hypothetical protein